MTPPVVAQFTRERELDRYLQRALGVGVVLGLGLGFALALVLLPLIAP